MRGALCHQPPVLAALPGVEPSLGLSATRPLLACVHAPGGLARLLRPLLAGVQAAHASCLFRSAADADHAVYAGRVVSAVSDESGRTAGVARV